MKTYCDKRHRIKHRKDGSFAIPQWKGLIFWHDYIYYPIDIVMGNLVMYSSARVPEFDTVQRAIKFIHTAMENEKNGASKIGIVEESVDIMD